MRSSKLLEVLKDEGSALIVKHNEEEITFDFGDESLDIKQISSSNVVHEKEPKDDKIVKDDNDFDFEIKFESKLF